ncbi:MAG TPA: DUF3015 family protein [Kofleriaceae bacterium]|jgi:hypothetical protein
MKKLVITAATLATMVLGAGSLAEAGPYGTAGCGLGSIVFGNSPGIVQIFAATTNGTFATQTFGITSGTSNCVDGGGGGPTAAAFIQTNRQALSKEISRGNGETIANLSTLSGCTDPNAVGASLQKNFKVIFPDATVSDTQVSSSMISVLRTDKTLGCAKLI